MENRFWRRTSALTAAVSAFVLLLSASGLRAESLKDIIPELLRGHNLVKASEADVAAADNRARVALGGWFPSLNVTATIGHEEQNKPSGTADTNFVTREVDTTLTQLLWDFGATNSALRTGRLGQKVARINKEAITQDLLLRAITAFLNVKRTAEVLEFARRSAANIRRQTELEDALVRKGAGLSTDVLQAKTQLAGAQARRVQAEGALAVAQNAFRAVFGHAVADVKALVSPNLPLDLLPRNLEDGVRVARGENPKILSAGTSADITRESVKTARASGFLPRFDAILESKIKEDVGGTLGNQQEIVGKVQLAFPFNLGFTAVNTLNAAKSDTASVDRRLAESRDLIEQQVRDSWSNLRTARETMEFLGNQANIAAEFLELARKERQLGNRSLLDVLNGETALINANSDAASAETDVAIAVYTLLNAMGRLDGAAATR